MAIILEYKKIKSKNNTRSKISNSSWFDILGNSSSFYLYIWWYIILSIFLHLCVFLIINYFLIDKINLTLSMNKKNIKPIKITIKDNELDKSNINYSHKKIIEMPQIKTQKPKEARYLGQVDHATEKETKLDEKYRTHKRGSEAGFEQQKSIEQTPNQQISNLQKSQQTITSSALTIPKHMFNQNNTNLTKKQWQQVYKNILPSQQNFTTSKNAGYQDYIDEDLEPSDRIDINTTEYRYIGYFSSLRKAIELVWTYPAEAVRNGISGQVELEFIIKEDGHVKKIQIIKSSGYRILDEAIVNAIKLASPFDPLPKDLGKRKLLVNGTFRYILTPY